MPKDENVQHITKMAELQEFFSSHRSWYYRGQKDPSWKLETTLERATKRLGVEQAEYERTVFREYRRHAHSFLTRTPAEDDVLEWLALMQHYGAPTRLLDFTKSFWIALYFAIEDADKDCVVWAINPETLGQKRGDFNKKLKDNIANGKGKEASLYHDVPFYSNDRLTLQKGTFIFSMDLSTTFQDQVVGEHRVAN